MRHLALLVAVYALLVALVLPGSLLASDEPEPQPPLVMEAEPESPAAPLVTEAEPGQPREEMPPAVASGPEQA